MNTIVRLSDISCLEVAPYAKLTEAHLRNRLHPEQGLFVCESMKVISIALEAGVEPISWLCEEKFVETIPPTTVPVYTAPRDVLASLTGYELSRGVLCAMRRPPAMDADAILRASRTVALLDGVVNSENIGAIFRAAAGLGLDSVLLTHTCCDPLVRRACRVSMGTVFQVPWVVLPATTDYLSLLSRCGFSSIAMTPAADALSVGATELRLSDRRAILLGSEGDGLPASVIEHADFRVCIPMHRGVDSLNVAAAAAVAFYELTQPAR